MFELLQRVMTETLLQVLKFTIEDSVQYHHTATERDRDIQEQFRQYSNRIMDCEAMMNWWVTVTNVLRRSPDLLEGPRVERSSPAGSYQLPVCRLCAGM